MTTYQKDVQLANTHMLASIVYLRNPPFCNTTLKVFIVIDIFSIYIKIGTIL